MGMTIDEKNKFIEESKKHFKEWHDMNYIPKADYENRLKADLEAILVELQLGIAELPAHVVSNEGSIIHMEFAPSAEDVYELIQQKIDKLKENKRGNNMISAEELLKVSERRGKKTATELGYSEIKSITNYYSKEQVINILNKILERFDEMEKSNDDIKRAIDSCYVAVWMIRNDIL